MGKKTRTLGGLTNRCGLMQGVNLTVQMVIDLSCRQKATMSKRNKMQESLLDELLASQNGICPQTPKGVNVVRSLAYWYFA